MNYQDVLFSSFTASLKVAIQGSGTINVPTTSTTAAQTATIPHNLGTSNLIWQVGGVLTDTVINQNLEPGIITPYSTFDGRVQAWATVDDTNLYITLQNSTAGTSQDATQFDYYYRVMVP